MLALPAPAASHADHPPLKLLTTLLAGGRASRLNRSLVEEDQLCVWVSADITEGLDASHITLAFEVVPGVEPARVEAAVLSQLDLLLSSPVEASEMERALQTAIADWVFNHEKVHEQALSAGLALTLFDAEYLDRHMQGLIESGAERLQEVAKRYLDPRGGGILGWSLPRSDA